MNASKYLYLVVIAAAEPVNCPKYGCIDSLGKVHDTVATTHVPSARVKSHAFASITQVWSTTSIHTHVAVQVLAEALDEEALESP